MKATYDLDIFTRAKQASEIVYNPKILISTAEHDIGSIYLYKVLRVLWQRFSEVEFTWLMGADNLEKFHLWEEYQELLVRIIFDRPNST